MKLYHVVAIVWNDESEKPGQRIAIRTNKLRAAGIVFFCAECMASVLDWIIRLSSWKTAKNDLE